MIRRISILVFSVFVLFCVQASAQTVDELINKNIEARGGLEKLKAVKTMRMTGKMIMQGMEVPVTMQMKRPNLMRMEMTFQGRTMVMAYDGVTAWWIMPFTGSSEPEKVPEDQAKNLQDQADFDGALVDYKEKGHTVELIGKEDMEGTPVYKLKLTKKNGDIQYIYLDAENFLELKTTGKRKVQGAEIEGESYISDYKSVSGLMIPHAIETKAKGQPFSQTIKFDKVELDVPLDDSIFKMPAKSQDKQPPKP